MSWFLQQGGVLCYALMVFSLIWMCTFVTVTAIERIINAYQWLDRKVRDLLERKD